MRTIHGLRHSTASILADRGVAGPIIQKLLGHANLATTQTYIKSVERHLDAVDRLDG